MGEIGGSNEYEVTAASYNEKKLRDKLSQTNPEELEALDVLAKNGEDISEKLKELGDKVFKELIQSQESLANDDQKKAADLQKKKETVDQGKTADKQAKKNAVALKDEDLRGLLESKTDSTVTDTYLQKVKGGKVSGMEDVLKQWRAGGRPIETPDDFILTSGGRLIQPNSKDTITGSKPGGPLAGRGATSIVNNYYLPNDANQNLNAITKAQKAGAL